MPENDIPYEAWVQFHNSVQVRGPFCFSWRDGISFRSYSNSRNKICFVVFTRTSYIHAFKWEILKVKIRKALHQGSVFSS